jgi:hypothetical protein
VCSSDLDGREAGAGEAVARGEFALGDGGVDDLERPGAIAAGIDVRLRGLLPLVDADAAVRLGGDAGGCEGERGGVGLAAEGIEEVLRATDERFSLVEKLDLEAVGGAADLAELRAGAEFEPFGGEGAGDGGRGLGCEFLETRGERWIWVTREPRRRGVARVRRRPTPPPSTITLSGRKSSSSTSSLVQGLDAARPGMAGQLTREPVAMRMRSAVSVSPVESATVCGSTKRAAARWSA